MPVALAEVVAARSRLRGGVLDTPCLRSVPLSEATGCEVWTKQDFRQRTGSFKERGARNALLQLPLAQRQRGVIAASAGNHALGLSWHGRLLGVPVTVVMPRFAPLIKLQTCQRFGAKIVLQGETFAEARAHADALAASEGLTYINGFDHPAVIAGAGTMALEILEACPELDAIVVPIGGGGLLAGIALVLHEMRPEVQIIGVEPAHAASFAAALQAGHPVTLPVRPTLADGLAVSTVGDNAFAIARERVHRVLAVPEEAIALAILRLIELEKSVVEGAGATGLGALLAGLCPELQGKRVVLPLCGGNIDPSVLARVIERGLAADGRLCRFVATISDRPGGLERFAEVIASTGASIRDLYHDRAFAGADVTAVEVWCTVETRDREHINELFAACLRHGLPARRV